ncbi:Membrane protein [Arthrobacter rhombi]|uniref:Membrane protein n=2 Tax=Micrococcales TaxID=85006 RepID=A0A1R4GNV2_9MICC|nr:Membrane protein [Arthrobacter rhombi]
MWILVVGTGFAGTAMVLPINLNVSIVVGIVVFFAVGIALLTLTPTISLTQDWFKVGRASIECRYIGEVSAHRGDDATFERGPALNGTAYLCLRGWIDPVVKLEIVDPLDATPYWLASTRRPEELLRALQQTARA